MLSICLKYHFCNRNVATIFKVRSRLADFFKHVHPDQMNQAPVIFFMKLDQN